MLWWPRLELERPVDSKEKHLQGQKRSCLPVESTSKSTSTWCSHCLSVSICNKVWVHILVHVPPLYEVMLQIPPWLTASKTDTFQSDFSSSIWASAQFMNSTARFDVRKSESSAVTALAIQADLADVRLHLLSILNGLDRAIVEGRPGLIWIQ